MNKDKYIWLIGENLGSTHNNNSFYFWREVVNIKDEIDKYLILDDTKENRSFVKELSNEEKKYIVWKNSLKHFKLYFLADMFFVTLSYRDVRPEKYLNKDFNFTTKKPVIYLQHGTIAMKKLGYTHNTYNNNLFRFVYYNKNIKEDLININKMKEYQLYYGEYLPRYKELIRKNELYKNSLNKEKQILWFITWREYFGDNIPTKVFIRELKYVITNKKLNEYLKKENIKLKVVLHTFFDLKEIEETFDGENSNIILEYQKNIDVMEEIIKSDLLITDYSSIGFDFSFLKKPVILFQPDLQIYTTKRSLYCSKEELKDNNIEESDELIETIVNKKHEINDFFSKRLPQNIDYNYVKEGKHIKKMYDYFYKLQTNKITFLGYNFFGIGGTVTATMALAEALLEKNYLVELISLKKIKRIGVFPSGLSVNGLYSPKSKLDKLLSKIIINKSNYGYLNYDPNKELIKPLSVNRLKKLMKNIKSKTVVSTRESLHLELKEATSKNIKNKMYFYHCDAEVFDDIFKGLIKELKKNELEKVVFVTQENKNKFKELYNYEEYAQNLVLGNSIQSNKIIQKEQIDENKKFTDELPIKEYVGIYLLRVNKDRESDINNLIKFGKYLRKNKIENIKINVYGKGNYVKEFIDMIIKERLEKIICYRGYTSDIKGAMKKSDCLLDFSQINSFGMTYIEAILNGKPVFCMKNTGSLEVLKDIPDSYFNSYEELLEKIYNLPNIKIEALRENYDKIYSKYSRDKLGNKFIKFMEE